MSQSQCLPLSRKRGAWCQEEEEEEEGEDVITQDSSSINNNNASNCDKKIVTGMDIDELQSIDAMAYLSMVQDEANLMPKVYVNKSTSTTITTTTNKTRNNNNKEHQHASNSLPVDGSAAMAMYLSSSSVHVLPAQHVYQLPVECDSWVTHTLAAFSLLRQTLEKKKQASHSYSRIIPFPPLKDSGGWHEFCLGLQEAEGNIDGYYDDENDKDNLEQQQQVEEQVEEVVEQGVEQEEEQEFLEQEEEPEWKIYMQKQQQQQLNTTTTTTTGMKPSVSLLLQMDQVMARRVLFHLTSWVVEDNFPMSYNRALWIYALLARLEKPLHRNESALLQTLLRTCCNMRAAAAEEQHTTNQILPLLNLLIAIVGIYFEQGPRVMSFDTTTSSSHVHDSTATVPM